MPKLPKRDRENAYLLLAAFEIVLALGIWFFSQDFVPAAVFFLILNLGMFGAWSYVRIRNAAYRKEEHLP